MKKTIILSSLTAILATACATPSYNYTPDVKYVSRPDIGVKTTAAVGDEMLVQGNLSAKDGISLASAEKVSLYSFSPGFYPQVGDDEKNTYYSFILGDEKNPVGGLGSAKKGVIADPIKNIAITKEDAKFCAVTAYNIKTCKKDIVFRKDNRSNESLDSFQQTLIYSGRVGNKVNIGYREFSGDRARPAFNNDVEYDLDSDKTIAYKGADIQILSADNKEITYIVNKNFRQPTR